MLYEDTSVDVNSDKRFHVELHFSPGSYADFDNPTFNITTNTVNSNIKQPIITTTNMNQSVNSRRLSFKKLGLQTLPEPNSEINELSTSPPDSNKDSGTEYSGSLKDNYLSEKTKPRSFEDEHHQNRLQIIKGKFKQRDTYNHYNTFHGSGTSSKIVLNYNFLFLIVIICFI